MTDNGIHRELKAIFSADAQGYSKLMGEDDERTVKTITTYREIIADLVDKHHGRVVDAPGDNVLAEFGSSLDAVRSAIEIQDTLNQKNADLSPNRRMDFRIGINLGDVLRIDDRIYGDGVNIAARIERLAEPGGICISRGVHEQVDGKLDIDFADLGAHSVKNISKPVNIYKVLLDSRDVDKVASAPMARSLTRRWLIMAAMVLVGVLGGVGIWTHQTRPEFAPASVDRMAYPMPDKPSIAVLPFANHSGVTKLDHFARGLTEDLTAALAKTPGLFVIAQHSTATYQGKAIDVKQVAEEQGVQYLLKGSLQEAEDRLRVTVQLIDALNGHLLWGNRFDRMAKHIFALQDEIVKRVIVELQVKLTQGDLARAAGRGTDNLTAWLLRIEASGEFIKFSREGMTRAREMYESAHQADPDWSGPLAGLASVDWYEAKRGWRSPQEDVIQSGMALARRAIQLDPDDPLAYQALGNLYALSGDADRAIDMRRKAAEVAPNSLFAVAGLATRLKDFGGEAEAVALFERAMRLSPKHPWSIPSGYGVALHLVGRKDDAVKAFERAIALNANHVHPHAFLAAVCADLGRLDEANEAADAVMRLDPNFTATGFMRSHTLHTPSRDQRFVTLMVRAGLPE